MRKNMGNLVGLSVLLVVTISIVGAGLLTAAPVRCDPTKSEETDLSGTYTGRVNYPDGNLMGTATLTITGNQFTLAGEGTTLSGRITARTTCDYTAATLRFGESTAVQLAPVISVRVRKTGNRLTLANIPAERRSFSFASSRHQPPQPPTALPTND